MRRSLIQFKDKDITKIFEILPTLTPLNDSDRRTICLKQFQFDSKRIIGSCSTTCRKGYPQVIVMYPVNLTSSTISSGILRLTCPHLVREIDQLEREGSVKKYNENLTNKPEIIEDFLQSHETWRTIRKLAMNEEEVSFVQTKLQDRANDVFESGLIGIPKGRYLSISN